MNVNSSGETGAPKPSPISKKIIYFIVLFIIVVAAFLGCRLAYDWYIGKQIKTTISEQLNKFKEEFQHKQKTTIEISNLWHADEVVVCRGYLESSERLTSSLIEAGITETVALKISKSPRYTEGIHVYFIKKNRVNYSYYPTIYMEKLGKDFVYSNVNKNIFLDITHEPFPSDSNDISIESIFVLEAVR